MRGYFAGYDYKYEVDVNFKTIVADSECENEWDSENIAAERFDSASNKFDMDWVKMIDTGCFDHKKIDGGYEVTAPYTFEATVVAHDDDEADAELENLFDESDIPADVEITKSYSGWRVSEAWVV